MTESIVAQLGSAKEMLTSVKVLVEKIAVQSQNSLLHSFPFEMPLTSIKPHKLHFHYGGSKYGHLTSYN
jgi:hypothetical protein